MRMDQLLQQVEGGLRKHILAVLYSVTTDIGIQASQSETDAIVRSMLDTVLQKIKLPTGAEDGGNSLTTINDELRYLIRTNADLAPAELAARIRGRFSFYTEARAQTIARTTATFNSNATVRDVQKRVAPKYRRFWLSYGDARYFHLLARNQQEDAQGGFTIGSEWMAFPAGGSDPKNNINCRCTTRLRLV